MVQIGTLLAGKYRIDRVLGQGGMGIVVQATHIQLHQPVAVKFLLPEVLANPQVVQRFLREAQAVVRLKNEHVARVIDVGALEDGAPYMVLEYLEGTDLADFPRQQLTIGQIVDLMLQACEALAEAHAMGIIHRDIKPANFFITRRSDGSLLLKVLDFGISKIQQTATERSLTASSIAMGTPSYMSPEQMKSARDVDHRSDIWALGVVLYELLQGTLPFIADSYGAMAIKIATEPLPPLSARLPRGLAEIVYRCLQKDRGTRFQNVAEFAHVLAPYAQSTAQAVVSVERACRVLGADPRPPSTLTSSTGAITRPPHPVRRTPIIAGGVAVVGAIVVAILISRGDDPAAALSPEAPSPAPSIPQREPAEAPAPPDAAGPTALAPAHDAAVPAADAGPPLVTTPDHRPAAPKQTSRPSGGQKQASPGDLLDTRLPY